VPGFVVVVVDARAAPSVASPLSSSVRTLGTDVTLVTPPKDPTNVVVVGGGAVVVGTEVDAVVDVDVDGTVVPRRAAEM